MYSSTAGATRNGVYRAHDGSGLLMPYESKFRFWGQCIEGMESGDFDRPSYEADDLTHDTTLHVYVRMTTERIEIFAKREADPTLQPPPLTRMGERPP